MFLFGSDQDELVSPARVTVLEVTQRDRGSELSSATMIPQMTAVVVPNPRAGPRRRHDDNCSGAGGGRGGRPHRNVHTWHSVGHTEFGMNRRPTRSDASRRRQSGLRL